MQVNKITNNNKNLQGLINNSKRTFNLKYNIIERHLKSTKRSIPKTIKAFKGKIFKQNFYKNKNPEREML